MALTGRDDLNRVLDCHSYNLLKHLACDPGRRSRRRLRALSCSRLADNPNPFVKERVDVKKLLSALVAVAFVGGMVGVALAQTPPATEKKADEKADKSEKKMEKKAGAKSASGSVKSASADSIVVAGKEKGKEAEWTFAVDPKTKIRKGGKDITAADLKAGDSVSVKYTDQDGKMTAQSVAVRGGGTAKKASGEKKMEKTEEKPAEKK
jgi:uncharacterized protein DUF5666